MSVSINKETKIYCSFSKQAGNKGCEFFNRAFEEYGINAIYKSFSVDDIYKAIDAAWILGFSGCAVAMPYKKTVMPLIDFLDPQSAFKCQSVNTILFDHPIHKLIGYNTDYYGTIKILSPHRQRYKDIFILGNGGLSGAVQAASLSLDFQVKVITRNEWSEVEKIRNSLVYNCTPLVLKLDDSNCYIDCLIGTPTGDLLHKYQSHKQFELYTGIVIDEIEIRNRSCVEKSG